MGKATIIAVKVVPLYEGGGSRVESLLNDSLLILGFLVVVLAPMALALAENGPGGTGWKLLTLSLLCLRCMVLYLPFKSAHCAWSVGPCLGVRDGPAHEP